MRQNESKLERESPLQAAAGFKERKPIFKTGFVFDNRYIMRTVADPNFIQ